MAEFMHLVMDSHVSSISKISTNPSHTNAGFFSCGAFAVESSKLQVDLL